MHQVLLLVFGRSSTTKNRPTKIEVANNDVHGVKEKYTFCSNQHVQPFTLLLITLLGLGSSKQHHRKRQEIQWLEKN